MVRLIGILNVTPDSFSDGGRFFTPVNALTQAKQLFADGAALIDVGAQATNPFVQPILADEEWARLAQVLPALLNEFPGRLSLDTFNPEVAEKALALGDIIINDVTTFRNPKLIDVIASHQSACIISHLPLAATSIQDAHQNYKIDSAQQVLDELMQQRQKLLDAGVKPGKIMLDPGIGFGKTMRLNWELLSFAQLVLEDQAVVIGFSRKRFLATDQSSGEPLPGADKLSKERNLEAATIAVQSSKDRPLYLRVHDVDWYKELMA